VSSPHIQELRGHYVRRRPSEPDRASRTPIVLTERDRRILAAVHVQGFLTTELVELAFFPPSGNTRSSPSSRAYERLRELWLWHYLERVELPVARVLGGRRPFLYTLGQPGVPLVEQRIGTTTLPVQPRRLDRLDHVFVDHDLQATAFWVNLAAQLRTFTPRVRRWTWLGERELRARRMRVREPRARFLAALPARCLLRGDPCRRQGPMPQLRPGPARKFVGPGQHADVGRPRIWWRYGTVAAGRRVWAGHAGRDRAADAPQRPL
jgi:hypothetical protein